MRMLKNDKGKIILTTNDEPKLKESEIITSHNIEAFTARRKAAADAVVEAEKEGGAK